jgi:hypothetical protein
MNQYFNDLITLLGGFGAVLSALFLYLGNLRLEKYKNALEKANIRITSLHEEATHVSKSRFDKEFEIYEVLWDSLVDLKFATLSLRPITDHVDSEKTEDEIKRERLNKYSTANTKFLLQMQKFRPFYSDEVNESLEKINKVSRIEAIGYQHSDRNKREYWDDQQSNEKEILSEIERCCVLIKKRIDSLSIVDP